MALFCFLNPALAQKKAAVESTSAVVERAQNLILQGDRHQALALLNRAIQRDQLKPQAQVELKKASYEMSRIFLSDKSQQAFEVALSLRRLEPAQALARLQEVLKTEPDQVLIILELSQVMMLRNECGQALELIEKTQLLIPFDEDLMLARMQSLLCLKRFDHPVFLTLNQQSRRPGPQQLFWLLIELEQAFVEESLVKARSMLEQIQKLDGQAPQIQFWRFRIEENKKNHLNSAQKYVMSCKNMTAADYRKYSKDPQLCKSIGEFENEIKATLAQQD